MPWSGKGLGLWGCKDSVRHFITSQIGQPAASRHFRHALQNLHLLFQSFSSEAVNGEIFWGMGSVRFIQGPSQGVCWPWSPDSCGILLTVAVKWCNTWYKWKPLDLFLPQEHITAGSSTRLTWQGKKIEISKFEADLNPQFSVFAVTQRDGGEFHNVPHYRSLLLPRCVVTSDLAAPRKKLLFLFTYFGRDSANLAWHIKHTNCKLICKQMFVKEILTMRSSW